ncbi:Glutamine-fructose-6-phosphate transaminase (Isomerizing) [Candidatus Sulfopaludibacter sp. SbA3]|nr:Glutamine-fructose-6-phosphate transaminase (Isomerizing) [Candidatus Sulfopaludibacter sp. SbA3]
MVIEGGYWRDILAQPAALADTLAGLDAAALADTVKRCRDGRFHRAVLTGMGGSYWALHPMHLALLNRGWNSILLETSELIHVLPGLLDSRTLLVVCSQSGRSAEIVRLLDVKQANCFTAAITNTPDSPLAGRADALILTRAGEEFTVSSKTYVTALMALKWMADALLDSSLERSRDELSQVVPVAAAYLRDWRSHVQSVEPDLRDVRDLFVLGRGASLAAAGVAGLIIKESTHLHGEGMSAAAFRHGPWEMIHPALYALVLAGDGEGATLALRLVQDIVAAGGRAAIVSEDARESLFRLPRVPASVRPIVEILPVEMLTLALASVAGREAGRFERATKVTTAE